VKGKTKMNKKETQKRMEQIFFLPDKTTTIDINKMLKAWRELAAPVERITGMKMYGFDPDLLIGDGTKSFSYPIWLAKMIATALAEKDREIERWKKIDKAHLHWDKDLQEQREMAEVDRDRWKARAEEARNKAIDEMRDFLLTTWDLEEGIVQKMIKEVAAQLKEQG